MIAIRLVWRYPSVVVCFCKQKTAYEMRISDWSSDVCSSDLGLAGVIKVDSAGLYDGHVGEAPDVRARAVAGSHGYDLSGLRAKEIGRASCRERVCQYV